VYEIVSIDALRAYRDVLQCFDIAGERHNHNFEVQDLVLRIPHSRVVAVELRRFVESLFDTEPLHLAKGLRKAERAYLRNGDRITKPSYIGRIRSYSDFSKRTKLISTIDQVKTVARLFCEEPNASYHVISIFRPIDLLEKFRPGYVPCVICADFKYREKKLTGKFFFRSCDAYNLLPFDLFYCVSVAEQLLDQIMMDGFKRKIELAEVMFWFSRIYVSRFDIAYRRPMLDRIERFTTSYGISGSRRRRILKDLRA
jgi:Thymidylate synthase